MTVVVWLRRQDGTLVDEVEEWSPTSRASERRHGPGSLSLSIPLTDPCMASLLHSSPVDGRIVRTWWDTDLELAVWESGTVGVAPSGSPDWCGPVVGGTWTLGRIEVRAMTREAYLGPIGDEVKNRLGALWLGGGRWDYDFGEDPSLGEWTVEGSSSASTTTSGPQYLGTRVALLEGTMRSNHTPVPISPNGNLAHVSVAVYVPTGVDTLGGLVGQVQRWQRVPGGAWEVDADESWWLELPTDYGNDRWYLVGVAARQNPGMETRYILRLVGGIGGSVRYGRPRITRPENVGAAADSDISQVPAAILDGQVDVLPGSWAYDVDSVGVTLSEGATYYVDAHEDAVSALGDWAGHGEHWVEDVAGQPTFRWAPTRGVEITSLTLTADDLSDWAVEVDGSGASSSLIGQIRPVSGPGPSDQVVVDTGAPPNRLVSVEQVPQGLGPSDARTWAEARLPTLAPAVTVRGVPAPPAVVDTATALATYRPGNWMTLEIEDGPLDVTLLPVVESREWDLLTGRVLPEWSLGGRQRDVLEHVTARLRALERDRRMRRESPSNAPVGVGTVIVGTWNVPPGNLGDWSVNHSIDVPEGSWALSLVQSVTTAGESVQAVYALRGGPFPVGIQSGAVFLPAGSEQAARVDGVIARGPVGPVGLRGDLTDTTDTVTARSLWWSLTRIG